MNGLSADFAMLAALLGLLAGVALVKASDPFPGAASWKGKNPEELAHTAKCARWRLVGVDALWAAAAYSIQSAAFAFS